MRSHKKALPVLPKQSESFCIVDQAPKTASLLFDRVICLNNLECPDPISFNPFKTDKGIEGRRVELEFHFDGDAISTNIKDIQTQEKQNTETKNIDLCTHWTSNAIMRVSAEEINQKLGLNVIPIYHSFTSFSNEYRPGNYGVIVACLENLQIVDEESIDWQQILEFRSDLESKEKYRRMIHWLDGSMVGKSESFIQDELLLKIEEYEIACKKHGIKTVLGTIIDIFDPKIITAATALGAALFQIDSFLGVIAGSGVTLANFVAKTTKSYLDLKSSKNEAQGQIAYVFELQKRFGN